MQPTIKTISAKKLIGHRVTMSLADNKTGALFAGFMPKRTAIKNPLSSDLYCLKTYPSDYFQKFNPATSFEKWAVVEVSDNSELPEGMEVFDLPGGLYAVFHYKGLNTDPSVFQYIFAEWLPKSEYVLDDRPHFDVLGSKYKNNDPASEEDLYIPVRKR